LPMGLRNLVNFEVLIVSVNIELACFGKTLFRHSVHRRRPHANHASKYFLTVDFCPMPWTADSHC